jgi:hypothetical protein
MTLAKDIPTDVDGKTISNPLGIVMNWVML